MDPLFIHDFHNLLIFSSFSCNTTHKFLIFYVILNLLHEDPTTYNFSGVSNHNVGVSPFFWSFFFLHFVVFVPASFFEDLEKKMVKEKKKRNQAVFKN
jgi:hypothetical protein